MTKEELALELEIAYMEGFTEGMRHATENPFSNQPMDEIFAEKWQASKTKENYDTFIGNKGKAR